MKITFLAQKSKINKAGLTPLRCRVTFEKQRKQFSTGVFIQPEHWSQEKQKVLDSGENCKTVNSQISLIKQKLGQAFLMLQIQGEPFDVDDIYKIYSGGDTKKEMGVIAVYVEHNNYYKKLVGKDTGNKILSRLIYASNASYFRQQKSNYYFISHTTFEIDRVNP